VWYTLYGTALKPHRRSSAKIAFPLLYAGSCPKVISMSVYPSLAEQAFGLRPPFDDPDAMMSQAYTTLTGERADVALLVAQNVGISEQVMSREPKIGLAQALYELGPDELARAVTLNMLVDIFKDHRPAYGTVLGAIPLYHTLYMEHATPVQQPQPDRKALLVGSISPVSAAGFVALSKCVLQAEPWIVDPMNDRYNRLHGNFMKADGLALPDEWVGSVHTIVTSRLLHMLVDADGRFIGPAEASEQNARRFAKAMFRLLEPGGHLLLCEQPSGIDHQDLDCKHDHNRQALAAFDATMGVALDEAGFSDVHISTGWQAESADFLFQPFDSSQPFARGPDVPFTRGIYAQKPDANSYSC
jgi:hypothetical protein